MGKVSVFSVDYTSIVIDSTNYSNVEVRMSGIRFDSAGNVNSLSIAKMFSTNSTTLWKYVEGQNASGALFVTYKRNGTWSSTGWHVIGG